MLKIDAIVLVGVSKRLENKHLLNFGSLSLIEYVIQNIKSFNIFDTIYLSTIRDLHIEGVVTVKDTLCSGPLGGIYSAMQMTTNPAFVFGGDMPFIKKEAVQFMISKFDGRTVIPRWKNGYIEPLHALYFIPIFPKIDLSSSLHELLSKIDKSYISAEYLDPITFFNINTASDFEYAAQINKTLK
ncbi:MAG: molybdenum cofactor guanylyltransferase [Thermoplasmata archaeon]